jgi:hypothetical protein
MLARIDYAIFVYGAHPGINKDSAVDRCTGLG